MFEMIGHSRVVAALRRNGGCASFRELAERFGQDDRPEDPYRGRQDELVLTRAELLVLELKDIVEDLERNGLIEEIDPDLFSLTE